MKLVRNDIINLFIYLLAIFWSYKYLFCNTYNYFETFTQAIIIFNL